MDHNMEAAIKQQIFRKQTPDYVAQTSPKAQLHSCTCCGDKFHLKSSYDFHINRNSVKITYTCKVCNLNYIFSNRCRLIQHLLDHSQSNVPFKLSDIKIYPCFDDAFCKPSNLIESPIQLSSNHETVNRRSLDFQPSSSSNIDNGANTPNTIVCNALKMKNSSLETNSLLSNKDTVNLTNTLPDPLNTVCNTNFSNHFNSPETFDSIGIVSIKSKLYAILELHNYTCTECNTKFKLKSVKSDKFAHFNKSVKSYICKVCTLNMPTMCSLKCHLRIHFQTSPHVCPDCGMQFRHISHLVFHATFICVHLNKSIYVQCSFAPCEAFLSVTEILKHFQSKHITCVYRCKHCLFISHVESDIVKHHNSAHLGIVYDNANIYHECFLCPTSVILPSDLEDHLKTHISHTKYYMFICPGCTNPLNSRALLLKHQQECIMYRVLLASAEKSLNHEVSSAFTLKTLQTCIFCKKSFSLNNSQNKFSQTVHCPYCHKILTGVLLNTKNDTSNGNRKESLSELEIIHSTTNNVQTKNKSRPASTNMFRCHLCKLLLNTDFKSINKHFAISHKELKFLDIRLVLTRLEDQHKASFKNINSTKSYCEKSVESNPSNKNATVTIQKLESTKVTTPLFEHVDLSYLQVNGRKRRKRYKNSENLTAFTSGIFVSSNGLAKEDFFVCSKCDFTASEIMVFREHIAKHRDVSTAYQCMECGSCFAVKPSFATHLFVCHKINDSDDYILKNNCYDEQAVKQLEEDLLLARFNTIHSSIDEFQCSICMVKCQNKSDFDKHFRVHGMAFLLKKTIRLSK